MVCAEDDDKTKILAEIGESAELLNNTVHGVVAAAALELVLKKGHKCEEYFEAVSKGNVQRLWVDLCDSKADTPENGQLVLGAVGESCEVLELSCKELATLHAGPLHSLNSMIAD